MYLLIAKRALSIIPLCFSIVLVVSAFIHIIPGDPVDAILGEYATEEDKQILRETLGLNQSFVNQTTTYFKNLSKADLGQSLIFNRPVSELIAERLAPTIELAICSIIVAILISIPLGVLSAVKAGKALDTASMVTALIGVAIPNFWLGPMLILLFSIHLNWLPVSERIDWMSYILPSITLGTALAAVLTRMTRNATLEVLKEDYIRTARAKGLAEYSVILKHALKNASLPIITIIGLQFGVLLTGAVITEKIFDWPGLGTLLLEAIGNRDYPLVQGCILIFSFTYIIVNLLTDLAYSVLDPRIKLSQS